jgi:hypothetical protein
MNNTSLTRNLMFCVLIVKNNTNSSALALGEMKFTTVKDHGYACKVC